MRCELCYWPEDPGRVNSSGWRSRRPAPIAPPIRLVALRGAALIGDRAGESHAGPGFVHPFAFDRSLGRQDADIARTLALGEQMRELHCVGACAEEDGLLRAEMQ